MKVTATRNGYHGQYREVGDQFEIGTEQEFSNRWMEKMDAQALELPTEIQFDAPTETQVVEPQAPQPIEEPAPVLETKRKGKGRFDF